MLFLCLFSPSLIIRIRMQQSHDDGRTKDGDGASAVGWSQQAHGILHAHQGQWNDASARRSDPPHNQANQRTNNAKNKRTMNDRSSQQASKQTIG
mmetsp:Transcript_12660/g.36834  ORF Transcript_12660/g.36834 Transcript_12660/m.36834 type:complete len:95 (-) Transcript_12660:391-675(-)